MTMYDIDSNRPRKKMKLQYISLDKLRQNYADDIINLQYKQKQKDKVLKDYSTPLPMYSRTLNIENYFDNRLELYKWIVKVVLKFPKKHDIDITVLPLIFHTIDKLVSKEYISNDSYMLVGCAIVNLITAYYNDIDVINIYTTICTETNRRTLYYMCDKKYSIKDMLNVGIKVFKKLDHKLDDHCTVHLLNKLHDKYGLELYTLNYYQCIKWLCLTEFTRNSVYNINYIDKIVIIINYVYNGILLEDDNYENINQVDAIFIINNIINNNNNNNIRVIGNLLNKYINKLIPIKIIR